MTANIGTIDRILRLLVGLALVAIPFLVDPATFGAPAVRYAVIAVGAVLILTAAVRFCPLYRLVGMRTCRV